MLPQSSDKAPFNAEGWELVKRDLGTALRAAQNQIQITQTSMYHWVAPAEGSAVVVATPTKATSGSGGGQYHTLNVTRGGQAGDITADSRNAEFAAYAGIYLGTFQVGGGDVLTLVLTVTGSTQLALTDLPLFVQFTPAGTV